MKELIKYFSEIKHIKGLLNDQDFINLLKEIEQWKKK
jgi:hypothetical protein